MRQRPKGAAGGIDDADLLVIGALTFVIHLIGTLAYGVRIAGTRTRRIALSLSLFNLLILVSRTSNAFQAPLLAKRIEENLAAGSTSGGLRTSGGSSHRPP
jgi:hypothetical protein